MKKNAIFRLTTTPGRRLPKGSTDWAALDAMNERALHAAARRDPDGPPMTATGLAGLKRVSRVKRLRLRLGMTQAEFATAFQLPISTLRDWEQRRTTPDAPARALLLAIERDPKRLKRLLSPVAA